MAFPTTYINTYVPIQSIRILGSYLPLFATLYYGDLVCAVYAAAKLKKGESLRAMILALSLVFVNVEFWNLRVNQPVPISDGLLDHAYISAVLAKGHLFGFTSSSLSYFATWPGMQLAGITLQASTGLSTTYSMILEVTAIIVVTTLGSYLFFQELTQSPFLAVIGAFMFNCLSVHFQEYTFTTFTLGYALAFLAFLFLFRILSGAGESSKSIFMLGVLAMSIGFVEFLAALLVVSVAFTSVLLVKKKNGGRAFSVIPLMACMLVIPELFNSGLYVVVSSGTAFLSGGLLGQLFQFAESKIGGPIPSWASYITLVWQVVLMLPALAAIVAFFLRRNSSGYSARFLYSGVLGLVIYGVPLLGGNIYATMLLVAVPVFSVPLILLWFRSIPRKALLTCLILILALSLPTFLAYNRNQDLYKVFPQTQAVDGFVTNEVTSSSGLDVYSAQFNFVTNYTSPTQVYDPWSNAVTHQQFWSTWNSTLQRLGAPGGGVLVFSHDSIIDWISMLNILQNDPHWLYIETQIYSKDIVYNNHDSVVVY